MYITRACAEKSSICTIFPRGGHGPLRPLTASAGNSRGGQSSSVINSDFARAGRYVRGYDGTARPADPQLRGRFRHAQDLHRTILRPITRASMDFARRPEAWPELEPNHGTDASRIAGWTYQAHAQSRFGGDILKQTGGRAVLRHDQVNPPVLIKISQRRAALLAEHFHA